MTFRFLTLGCKLNFAESSFLAHKLRQTGLIEAQNGEAADICILHSCSVTNEADRKNIQAIHRLRRENPRAVIILIGCYAQLIINNGRRTATIEKEVDYVLSQDEKFDLPNRIHDLILLKNQAVEDCPNVSKMADFNGAFSFDERTRCFLKIQDGCNYGCSYCTIPLARGKSRSESIEKLVMKANNILHDGFKEIILTGVNIGDFGRSSGERFIELLYALDNLDGGDSYRIRISNCEPNLLTDDIIDFVRDSKHVAPHFHLPLQSGSDAVLKIMGRRYSTAQFKQKIDYIHQQLPHAFIGIDCMVGVRGETEERFGEYVDFLSGLRFSQLHVFTYSERENTRILSMDLPIIPLQERQKRNAILQKISRQHLENFYKQHIGMTATVLWEEGKKSKNNAKMFGFTENYIRLARSYDASKVNQFETIVLDSDLFHLCH